MKPHLPHRKYRTRCFLSTSASPKYAEPVWHTLQVVDKRPASFEVVIVIAISTRLMRSPQRPEVLCGGIGDDLDLCGMCSLIQSPQTILNRPWIFSFVSIEHRTATLLNQINSYSRAYRTLAGRIVPSLSIMAIVRCFGPALHRTSSSEITCGRELET